MYTEMPHKFNFEFTLCWLMTKKLVHIFLSRLAWCCCLVIITKYFLRSRRFFYDLVQNERYFVMWKLFGKFTKNFFFKKVEYFSNFWREVVQYFFCVEEAILKIAYFWVTLFVQNFFGQNIICHDNTVLLKFTYAKRNEDGEKYIIYVLEIK